MIRSLPGSEILVRGIEDLNSGRITESALLCLIGKPRLTKHGFEIPQMNLGKFPEHALYDLISNTDIADPYGRYNSLIRLLVSLENALDVV